MAASDIALETTPAYSSKSERASYVRMLEQLELIALFTGLLTATLVTALNNDKR